MNMILAVLVLGAIITIHEFGHFLFAKLNGIGVIEFSLGMGPRLFSVEKGGTRYSVKILPFGGSCMMLGEDENEEDEHAFNNKPVWARISVVAAGPVFNFLLAFVLAAAMLIPSGYTTSQIREVQEGYPAQKAGMLAGDVITKINGRSIHSYYEATTYLFTHPGQELTVSWKRTAEDGTVQTMKAELEPVASENGDRYLMGVVFDASPKKITGPLELLREAFYEVRYQIRYVFDSLYMMFHGYVSVNDISGPVGIVTAIDSTVDEVAPYGGGAVALMLVSFSVLLSANLGVMNLLPIPALDGGRLVFLLIEAVRGKPIDKEKEGMVHMAGMAFLLALMVLILFNDIRKLFW